MIYFIFWGTNNYALVFQLLSEIIFFQQIHPLTTGFTRKPKKPGSGEPSVSAPSEAWRFL